MTRVRTGVLGLGVCLIATLASAHSLNLFVHAEGTAVKGNAYFTGGTPAQSISVQVQDVNGKEFGETTTDAEGNFVYSGPFPSGTTVFVVSTPDGHRAESKVEWAGGQIPAISGAAPPVAPDALVTSNNAQLTRLHEAIDRLEKRLWLRDVIGGIGYIFGLAGLWALWKARSGSRGH